MIVYTAMTTGTDVTSAVKYMEDRIPILVNEGWTKQSDIKVVEGRARLGGRHHVAKCVFAREETTR